MLQDAEVRQAGVRSLIRLYQDERNVSPLEDFTERFSRRFVELIYDIDTSVAVLAVKLLKQVVDIQAVSKDKISEVYGSAHHFSPPSLSFSSSLVLLALILFPSLGLLLFLSLCSLRPCIFSVDLLSFRPPTCAPLRHWCQQRPGLERNPFVIRFRPLPGSSSTSTTNCVTRLQNLQLRNWRSSAAP